MQLHYKSLSPHLCSAFLFSVIHFSLHQGNYENDMASPQYCVCHSISMRLCFWVDVKNCSCVFSLPFTQALHSIYSCMQRFGSPGQTKRVNSINTANKNYTFFHKIMHCYIFFIEIKESERIVNCGMCKRLTEVCF